MMWRNTGGKRLWGFCLSAMLCLTALPPGAVGAEGLQPEVIQAGDPQSGAEELTAQTAELSEAAIVTDFQELYNANYDEDNESKSTIKLNANYIMRSGATDAAFYTPYHLDLNGHTLTIDGNLMHTKSEVLSGGVIESAPRISIGSGTLHVTGDYVTGSNAVLRMIEERGVLDVDGDLIWGSEEDFVTSSPNEGTAVYYSCLYAGTIRVGGDISVWGTQLRASAEGTNKLVLDGGFDQTVSANNADYYFNEIQADKRGGDILLQGYLGFAKLGSDFAAKTVSDNTVYLTGNEPLMDINGYALTIDGNVQQNSRMKISGGLVTVSGNFIQDTSLALPDGKMQYGTAGQLTIGGGTLHVTGDCTISGNGFVRMTDENDVVDVDGDLIWKSGTYALDPSNQYYNCLHAGRLFVAGDIDDTEGRYGIIASFDGSTHRTILDGEGTQTITLRGSGIDPTFNILEQTKGTQYVYSPSDTVLWKTRYEGHTGGAPTCVDKAVCTVCEKEYLDPEAHAGSVVKNQKTATCAEKGYTGDTYCRGCDALLSRGEEIGIGTHQYDTWTTVTAATHTADGVEESVCVFCKTAKQTRPIAKGEHSYAAAWSSDETKHWHDCSANDGGRDSEAAHTFREVIDKAATQSAAGSKHEECAVCGYRKAAVAIEKLPAAVKDDKGDAVISVKKPGTVKDGKVVGGEATYKKPAKSKANVTVPDKVVVGGVEYAVTAIQKDAFKNDKKLKSVTIPKTVKTIGANAFSGCKKLKTVTIRSANVTSIGKNALKGIHKNAVIKVPKAKYAFYKKKLTAKTGFQKTMKLKKI